VLIPKEDFLNMRNKFLSLAFVGALAMGATGIACAQDSTPPVSSDHGMHGRAMDPDSELAHMTKALDLTEDQQAQIKPLLVEQRQQEQALRQDQSPSQEDRRAKAHAMREETHRKIGALLTDEQKQKAHAMEQRMHRGEPNNQPAPAPTGPAGI
jgi:Spy/CpxP family protein refolding chaperone